MRKISLLLCIALLVSWILPGCSEPHTCSAVCDQCGLCLNTSCTEPECGEKCAGHHSCTNICSQCGLCRNSSCEALLCKGSVSLEGISCIRLPGSGRLQYLKITGYEGCG